MGKFVKLSYKNEISEGKIKEIKVEGKTIAVANIGGEYLAFDGVCTHAQCALAGGYLDGYTLTCYCHGAQFDVKTGGVLAPPARAPLNVYKVKVEGEDLLIEI